VDLIPAREMEADITAPARISETSRRVVTAAAMVPLVAILEALGQVLAPQMVLLASSRGAKRLQ
jgi:hypothetical protein